ncbi:MAG: MOSC domain-containing protein [Chloroflexales bacterium]|nr:MOSC domain-containing protein [Chloroflexales bacterium]
MSATTTDEATRAISANWSVALVQAGRLEAQPYHNTTWTTAIYKRPLEGRVAVTKQGLAGDEHTGHGPDLDRAVCFHSIAHYDFWRAYFRRDIPLGFFGENVTLHGALDEQVCVGDVFRCGTVLFEITQPRTPCFKQARKLGVPTFVKLLLQTGKLGYLARVLEEGTIGAGDAFALLHRPCPQANLVYVNCALYEKDNAEAARELAALAPLAHDWQRDFAKKAEG